MNIMNPTGYGTDESYQVMREVAKMAKRQIKMDDDSDDYLVIDKATGRVLSRHETYRKARKAA